jgi:hypothetical protein
VVGGPGCGFEKAAFCDTFDAPSANRGRAGELDVKFWSASRGNPQLATGLGVEIAAGAATLRECRSDLPLTVFPSDDAVICDANSKIASHHLMVACGSQNYGQNSYRIRQPFDFAGRTGKIVFDAQGFLYNPLIGWISLAVVEDPTPTPGYAVGNRGQTNDEGTPAPRNGFEVHFADHCFGSNPTAFGLRMIDVFNDYQDSLFQPATPTCTPSAIDQLNHFEVTVSQSTIEVYASPVSVDGVTFDAPQLMLSAEVSLPFSRGYVTITTHNHASLKYSGPGGFGPPEVLDAWISRWDNVGFDGPVIDNWREYEVSDSLVPGEKAWNVSAPVMSYGYVVGPSEDGPAETFRLEGVELDGVTSARLASANWYNSGGGDDMTQWVLQFRFNGGPWRDRKLTPSEIALLSNGHAQGALSQMIDVPLEDLVAGDNTLEFQTVDVDHSYPPAVSAIDLILAK